MKPLRLFTILFCLVLFGNAFAQTHTAYPNTPLATKAKGYYEYLPEGYNPNGSATYPLILFMHGVGEFGNGSATQLPKVLGEGIPKLIEAGTFPKSFVVKGETHRFVIITPQFVRYPQAADMDEVLNSIIAKYKINTSRIYITGLSYGGGLTFAYAGANNAYAQRIAAIVPSASPLPDGGYETIYARSRVIAANNVAVWATHNRFDRGADTSAVTVAYVDYINQNPAPTPRAKMTLYNSGGHDSWTKTYDPKRILDSANGYNVYQWMLQYQRGTPTPNQPPVAAAGGDQTITLPANSATLTGTGTDSDGSIATYNWAKVSGPAAGNITNASAASTTVTSLAQGTYVFRLTVTDNSGATATDDVTVTVNAAPNTPPTANAGGDQTITLPTNSVNLSGSGTDSEGAVSFAWTKQSGPAGGTIASPASATTAVSALQQGTYVFRLTVTDGAGATATDDVTITVAEAPNQPPVAAAGGDQTITLPTNSVALTGSGSDADGTIATYNWTKISGPSAGTITTPTAASTTVTGLSAGVYVFRLTVTDNKGATSSDEVQITVAAAPNQAPAANAGSDVAIKLPTNQVTLTGSATDGDGTITAYSWTKVSGPAGGSIASPSAASTSVTGLVQGTYVFRLTVTDNDGATAFDDVTVTVNSAPNQPPTANAGTDQSLTLPTNSTTLNGSGTDADGTIATYAWTKLSGPAAGTIANAAAAVTNVTGLVQGNYVFRLTVTDNSGATASDDVSIVVNAAPNNPPVANAGGDQTITLPTNSVSVTGSGTDSDGTIASYAWSKLSGPAGGTITNPAAATTTITGLTQGTYTFRLTVTDNSGAAATDDVVITVNAAANVPPQANAGTDVTITLPTNSVSLAGSGTDSDGTITGYAWTKVSGPAGGNITTPNAASTTVTGLQQGGYVFRLTVTDNDGATATDDVAVTVAAVPNQAPTANAGADQTITLPLDSVTLTGSGSDADGAIAGYAWVKVSGPAAGTITNASGAETTVTGLVEGTYVYRLTVTDNAGATHSDEVKITVNAAANQAPVADAGGDQTITLPTNQVTLTGSAADADGQVTAYQWTKVSGPAAGAIASSAAAATSVTGLVQGTYVFRLTVTDNKGATGFDDITITVAAAPNAAPTANAGGDQTITLPVNMVTLIGTGTDSDGTITAYSWTKLSGPAGAAITTPANDTTAITGLVQGSYVFRLTVTDNSGATATDEVTIVVNAAANKTPVANAGADQTITLPTNSITLAGAGTDADGTIATYAWTKVSGPISGAITNATAASTTVTALVEGTYVFRLTVTDNDGATASDDVTVVVKAAPAENKAPLADAGADVTITLPANTATLSGSGTDSDGTIASYAWTKVSGPAQSVIATPAAATTVLTNLAQGIYVFHLTVTDNNGATGSDDVTITVAPAPNVPPTVNAGQDQTITLPVNTVTLNATATDSNGTIAQYAWSKLSGPVGGAIINPAAAATLVTGLLEGTYVFRITVTDDSGATASDSMRVVVKAATNVAPQVNVGLDTTVTLPKDSVVLVGTASDADGSIATYTWEKVSGPAGDVIVSPNAGTTVVKGLKQGRYVFRLTVTDNKGAAASDSIAVEVTVVTSTGPNPSAPGFSITTFSNPTAGAFVLKINTASPKPARLLLTDAAGRKVEERANVPLNTTFSFGHNQTPGVYYAQIVQNGKRVQIKLLKLQ